ncbi:MAG: NAD-dependent epimerase/dehydratase [Gemmatimonadetes bacterium]|nr:NAD-dependent epimerase/dehydratase [Gemmatimonadota bacterium]
MTRYLLTGGGGFVGQWLARTLVGRGDEVTLAGIGSLDDGPRVLTPAERARVRWISADFRSQPDVTALIEAGAPDVVVHLAGVAFPPDADRDPAGAYDINALGVVRLLAAVARAGAGANPTVVVVGSALQYGAHDAGELPLAEDAEQRPLTLYAASKAAQEVAALQAFRETGLRVVCTRSFNHTGPGHGDEYLLPSLVRRARQMKRDGSRELTLGGDTVRDYLHISDVVHAYLALAERGTPGEVYNVASGVGVSVRQLAADVLLHAGVTADISTDPSLVRATDIPVLVGSPAKLMRTTGWAPTKTHADIIDDLLHAATD